MTEFSRNSKKIRFKTEFIKIYSLKLFAPWGVYWVWDDLKYFDRQNTRENLLPDVVILNSQEHLVPTKHKLFYVYLKIYRLVCNNIRGLFFPVNSQNKGFSKPIAF